LSQIPNTLIIGKVLHHLKKCESTNLYAKQVLAKNKPPEGTVISTDNQTAGRGQFGNIWQSDAQQNIMLSIILYPNLTVDKQFYLSKLVSVACVKALKSITNLNFEIKWPNDIYYKNQKVGGILIENQLLGSKITNSIVGIGLNLNQEEFVGLPHATSVYNLVHYLLSRKKCIEILLQHIEVSYLKLRQNQIKSINKEYFEHLKSYQTTFTFKEKGEIKEGFLESVNDLGQLVVVVEGKKNTYSFKEIEWIL
jgi:BirA family biotin operon repressor/biotin-[acetyl-CoA-carboxylase] ligase